MRWLVRRDDAPGHRAGTHAQDSPRAPRPERLLAATLDYPNPMWCMVRATWPLSITTPHWLSGILPDCLTLYQCPWASPRSHVIPNVVIVIGW